jgi:hypothetical protein
MINQKKDLDMITRKIKVEIPTFHYDDLEVSEITTETSWMKLHISVLFIKDDVQITKELYKDYESGLWYYIKSDGMIISHKDTFNHTIKNLIDEMIYDCHLEMEEVAKENEETDKTEYCESTNNDIKGHIYVDTDSVKVAPLPEQQTSEESIKDTIMTDDCIKTVLNMEELFSQMFGNTIRSKCKMYNNSCYGCPADRQGNRCGGEQWCKQTWKRYGAIVNPEWHHVSLATLANIDFDMLDEKRKLVFDINQILKDGIRNLYKCENHISFEVLERYVIRKCDELIRHNRLKAFWFSYIARQLDDVRRNTIYLYTPYITAHRNRW